ncbi:MAG: hypothetical protein ACE5HI_04105 [bacterium]
MQRFFIILTAVCAFTLTTSQIYAGDDASGRFEKIRSLVGDWQGKRFDGKTVKVSYEVVSNGSAVIERIMPEDEPNMVTMYHLDGDALLMTHYCAANNQPRMKAVGGEESIIKFELKDITNLTNPTDGHMHKLAITFKDHDHISHLWTFKQEGKEQDFGFELARTKMSMK